MHRTPKCGSVWLVVVAAVWCACSSTGTNPGDDASRGGTAGAEASSGRAGDAGTSGGRPSGEGGNGVDAGDAGTAGDDRGTSGATDGGTGGSDGPEPVPGEIVWARSLSSMAALGVEVGPGGVVVSGYIDTPANLGGATLVPVGPPDGAVAGFDPRDGAHLYSSRFGSTGSEYAWLDTAAVSGAPILYGITFGDPVDVGKGAAPGGGGALADAFIGRYGPGPAGWVHRMATPEDDRLNATAPGPSNTVYASGSFTGTTTLNGQNYTSAGARDVFLARFNAFTGAIDTVATFGSSGREESAGLAWSGTHLVMSGFFDGTTTFGATSLTSAGGLDVFLVKLDPDATPVWAVRLGGAGEERDSTLAVDARGDIYLGGTYTEAVTFGDFELLNQGLTDVYLIKLSGEDGSVLWATSIGSTGPDAAIDMALTSAGEPIVAGSVGDSLGGFTGAPHAGGLDSFLMAVDSTGVRRWTRVFGTTGDDRGTSVATEAGAVYFGVWLNGPFDLGVPLLGEFQAASVLMRLNP